jgi:NAD(P)-dependent dehydrogenase (short-subunit alcohol dehydrogenase family)
METRMKLNDRNILVTGANRGIGRALVDALLAAGAAKVYAGARRLESLPDFGDSRVQPVQIDITDPASVQAAAEVAADVDLLVNNAGTAQMASVTDAPLATLEADMNVNYYGTLNVIRRFLPTLDARPGAAIVNVVTVAAFVNFPGLGGYSASKAALFSVSQGLRIELAPRGIAVHTVNPGPIDTDMAKDLDMDKSSPETVAANVVRGLEADEADIFPDPAAEQMIGLWKGNYRDLEAAVYDLHHAA